MRPAGTRYLSDEGSLDMIVRDGKLSAASAVKNRLMGGCGAYGAWEISVKPATPR